MNDPRARILAENLLSKHPEMLIGEEKDLQPGEARCRDCRLLIGDLWWPCQCNKQYEVGGHKPTGNEQICIQYGCTEPAFKQSCWRRTLPPLKRGVARYKYEQEWDAYALRPFCIRHGGADEYLRGAGLKD